MRAYILIAVLLLVPACAPSDDGISLPSAPAGPDEQNLAGQAYVPGDSISSRFAPPWDVFAQDFMILRIEPGITPDDDLTISVTHPGEVSLTLKQAWVYSPGTGAWQSIVLDGQTSPLSADYLQGDVTTTLPRSLLSEGDNYVAAFICTDVGYVNGRTEYACGCRTQNQCGLWNLQHVSVGGSSDPDASDLKELTVQKALALDSGHGEVNLMSGEWFSLDVDLSLSGDTAPATATWTFTTNAQDDWEWAWIPDGRIVNGEAPYGESGRASAAQTITRSHTFDEAGSYNWGIGAGDFMSNTSFAGGRIDLFDSCEANQQPSVGGFSVDEDQHSSGFRRTAGVEGAYPDRVRMYFEAWGEDADGSIQRVRVENRRDGHESRAGTDYIFFSEGGPTDFVVSVQDNCGAWSGEETFTVDLPEPLLESISVAQSQYPARFLPSDDPVRPVFTITLTGEDDEYRLRHRTYDERGDWTGEYRQTDWMPAPDAASFTFSDWTFSREHDQQRQTYKVFVEHRNEMFGEWSSGGSVFDEESEFSLDFPASAGSAPAVSGWQLIDQAQTDDVVDLTYRFSAVDADGDDMWARIYAYEYDPYKATEDKHRIVTDWMRVSEGVNTITFPSSGVRYEGELQVRDGQYQEAVYAVALTPVEALITYDIVSEGWPMTVEYDITLFQDEDRYYLNLDWGDGTVESQAGDQNVFPYGLTKTVSHTYEEGSVDDPFRFRAEYRAPGPNSLLDSAIYQKTVSWE